MSQPTTEPAPARRATLLVPSGQDALLAVVVAAGSAAAGGAMSASLGMGDPGWTAGLVALESAPLAWRRRAPLAVLVATVALGIAVAAAPATLLGLFVAALVATYALAVLRGGLVALVAGLGLGAVAPITVVSLLEAQFPYDITVVPAAGHVANALAGSLLAFGGAVALGASVRIRRAYTASVEAHAAQLERERVERERRAVLEERARIARELHDVAAHHLSGLVLQAGALERTVERDPQAAQALAKEVRGGGAQALASMRRLVGLLRADDDPADQRGSHPSLDDLAGLIERARADGLRAELRTAVDLSADGVGVADEVELAAYRVVQEALSNARRHAPGAHVSASVRLDGDELIVEVVDDGPHPTEPDDGPEPTGPDPTGPEPTTPDAAAHRTSADVGGGHGLIGMRERAELLGGTLEAGPRDGAGWQVRATLPVTPKETP